MITAATLLLAVLGAPLAAMSVYLLVLTLLSGAPRGVERSSRSMRFAVIVPAHDEEATIETVLESLSRLNWPRTRVRIHVVADNCTDGTAARARERGARVLVRTDPERRGKGYALESAFRDVEAAGWADAVVVVDADSEVSANLLEACAARLESGAHAVQVHHRVLNNQSSARTRLQTIALTCFHQVRSRARERLFVSSGIRGNGWCVTLHLLQKIPYHAFSLAEDIEYGIRLGLAGQRVHYADEASVAALMVSGEKAARLQRQRWEHGRFQMVRQEVAPLFRAALARGDAVCLDLALDLLVLPLATIAAGTVLWVLLAGVGTVWNAHLAVWLGLALGSAAAIVVYVLRGWQLSGLGARGLIDLLSAPAFIVWKLLVMLGAHDATEWVRTRREPP